MFLSLFLDTKPFECCLKTRYGKNGLVILKISFDVIRFHLCPH